MPMIDPMDAIQIALLRDIADGRPVSGQWLATRFGISRAAIAKRMTRWREAGLDLIAVPGVGYRLRRPLELLDAGAIDALLSADAGAVIGTVDVAWEVDSTNAVLMREAAAGARDNRVLLAERQTAGRGRRGRHWQGSLGGSIALSLRWHFDAGMASLAGLGAVAGLAIIEALADNGIIGLTLKWPNDVVADGRKLAGILVEVGGEAQGPCHAVIGIGINLRIDDRTAARIDQDWTDVASLAPGNAVTANRLVAALLNALTRALPRFGRQGFGGFIDAYTRYDALHGRTIRIIDGHGEQQATAMGVDARGALRVRGDNGEHTVESGEVSIRWR